MRKKNAKKVYFLDDSVFMVNGGVHFILTEQSDVYDITQQIPEKIKREVTADTVEFFENISGNSYIVGCSHFQPSSIAELKNRDVVVIQMYKDAEEIEDIVIHVLKVDRVKK